MDRFFETLLARCKDLSRESDAEQSYVTRFQEARAAWPTLDLDPGEFAAFVAERLAPLAEAERAKLRFAELLLACGCQQGNPEALTLFEKKIRPHVERIAGRYLRGESDELLQTLQETLFLGRGGRPPKIGRYTGRGDFSKWAGVVATRLALKAQKSEPGALTHDERALEAVVNEDAGDPELRYLKQAYRPAFRAAFKSAIAALTPQDRNLLRYRYVDGLQGKRIAVLLEVHPSTVGRRLVEVGHRLRRCTLEELERHMELSPTEAESVLRLLSSHLEASVSRYLNASDA